MDVKLESTGWHRITAREIGEVARLAASSKSVSKQISQTGPLATEKKKILMIELDQNGQEHQSTSPPVVALDEEDSANEA